MNKIRICVSLDKETKDEAVKILDNDRYAMSKFVQLKLEELIKNNKVII